MDVGWSGFIVVRIVSAIITRPILFVSSCCWLFCAGLRAGVRGRGEMSARARSCLLPPASRHPPSDASHLRPRPSSARRPADHPQVGEKVAAEAAAVHRRAVARQGPSPPTTPRQPLTPVNAALILIPFLGEILWNDFGQIGYRTLLFILSRHTVNHCKTSISHSFHRSSPKWPIMCRVGR